MRQVFEVVQQEIDKAISKFPTWPDDPLHALAVLGEEFGELTKEVLQSVYEPHKSNPGKVETEAIQTAAMAIRFLASLKEYRYSARTQHKQGGWK
jgi:NTP pyrophosphatase (non-canonical NTP hydrolase)